MTDLIQPELPRNGEVLGACPLDCPDGCSWVVTVKDGKAVKLRGNPYHPFTRGGLCKKVNPWLEYAEDPGRLLYPLRRIKPKGPGADPSDAFVRITWEEALAEIAERFTDIIKRSGPAAIWPFSGTGNVGMVQGGGLPSGSRLWNHLGVSGHLATICSVSGHVGLGYTMGIATGMDPEDVVSAGTILIWGSNTLIANQHFWPFVEEAKANGAKVVVIDPVRTRTAARADQHLAPRVGTDAALALGLCRAIVEAGGHDEAFLADNTVGFDEFLASIDPWTVEKTAAECGLEPAEINDMVGQIIGGGPLAIKVGQGIQRSAYGGQTTRVVSCLAAVTGAFSKVGGGLVYSTGAAYDFNRDAAAGTHLGSRPRDLVMTTLAADLDRVDDPPVEALFVYAANPVVSNPDTTAVRQSLSRPDLFTVAVDIYHTETTEYADIVLPSTMQHEQLEVNDSFSHLYLSLNMPAVSPPGECLAHTEIFRRLARAMGLDEPCLYATDMELAAAVIDTPAFAAAGITVESLQETGWARLPGAQSPYRPFADGFPTPSGRFEFTSEQGEVDGHGRLPNYRRAVESGRPEGPGTGTGAGAGEDDRGGWYDLVAAAGDWHINSVFAGTAKTRVRTGQPRLAVHPDDAQRDGLVDGDNVKVSNGRGSFEASIVVNESVRRGLAATTKGWWGMGINNTVAERDSDMGRGAVYHDNRVRINRRS